MVLSVLYIQLFLNFNGHFNQKIVPGPGYSFVHQTICHYWVPQFLSEFLPTGGSVSFILYIQPFPNFVWHFNQQIVPGLCFCSSNPFQLFSGSVSLFSTYIQLFPKFDGHFINRLCPGYYFVHQTVSNYRASPVPVRILTNRWFCQFCFVHPTFFQIYMGILINRLCLGYIFVDQSVFHYWAPVSVRIFARWFVFLWLILTIKAKAKWWGRKDLLVVPLQQKQSGVAEIS